VQGRLESPSFAGYLELHDFTTDLRLPPMQEGATVTPARRLRTSWDLLQGDVQYSSTGESLRNGLLRKSGASINVDASLGLTNGAYDRNQPFNAHLRIDSVPASELKQLLASSAPITGRVSGELQLNGHVGHLLGTGHLSLRDATAWQQSLRSATADLAIDGSLTQLRNIVVKSDAMQLTGDARINAVTSEFAFHLKGTEVRLEDLRALASRNIALSGQAAFEASGEGTPSAPVINGRLRLRNLSLRGRQLGSVDVDAVTHGAEMTLSARPSLPSAQATLQAQVHLRGAMPMHLTGELHSTDLSALAAPFLPLTLPGAGEISLHLDATGEAMHPADLSAQIQIDRLATNYAGIAIDNEGPIRLSIAHQVLSIDYFRLAGEQGTRFLRLRGQVQLGGSRQLDLRADGSVNLKLLETYYPKLSAGGAANLNLHVDGTMAQPSMHGHLNVQNGSLNYTDFPNGLSDINGSLLFSEDHVQLQELTARTGGGLLNCSGFFTYLPAQGIGFNLAATGKDIRLRYPEGISSTADASLTLSGTEKSLLLGGTITVNRLAITPQFDAAEYLVKGIRGAPAQKIESPLSAVRLDVRVVSTPELQFQTSLARLSGNLDLHLRGSAFRPILLGRVNLLEGTLDLNGTKYRIERGDITFNNPVRIYPNFDIELSARVRDYDLTLGFQGPIDRLTTTYRSDPPLSSTDIISLLALGRTTNEEANPALMGSSQYRPAVSASSSTEILSQALSATRSSRVQQLFGASRVKIDPNVGEATNAGLARVTVEQQISNNLTLTYITNLNQSAQEIIQGELNVKKDVSVVGIRNQDGVVSFALVFRKRKK
jgi:translocation and assembly module TamB